MERTEEKRGKATECRSYRDLQDGSLTVVAGCAHLGDIHDIQTKYFKRTTDTEAKTFEKCILPLLEDNQEICLSADRMDPLKFQDDNEVWKVDLFNGPVITFSDQSFRFWAHSEGEQGSDGIGISLVNAAKGLAAAHPPSLVYLPLEYETKILLELAHPMNYGGYKLFAACEPRFPDLVDDGKAGEIFLVQDLGTGEFFANTVGFFLPFTLFVQKDVRMPEKRWRTQDEWVDYFGSGRKTGDSLLMSLSSYMKTNDVPKRFLGGQSESTVSAMLKRVREIAMS
jgi:hypothetical protein